MEIKRRTNILVQTEKRFIVSQTQSAAFVGCGQCGSQMILAQPAADLLGVSSRQIYRLIEAETVHFLETDANEIFVCRASVEKHLS